MAFSQRLKLFQKTKLREKSEREGNRKSLSLSLSTFSTCVYVCVWKWLSFGFSALFFLLFFHVRFFWIEGKMYYSQSEMGNWEIRGRKLKEFVKLGWWGVLWNVKKHLKKIKENLKENSTIPTPHPTIKIKFSLHLNSFN